MSEWNSPIDSIQADCLSLRSLIRGWIADAKARAARWEPRPCPRR
jgi:hypothetical protein